MNDSIHTIVPPNQPPERLEAWLGRNVKDLSRHKAIELIREGAVFVDGRKAKKGIRVSEGQTIEIRISQFAFRNQIGKRECETPNAKHRIEVEPKILFSDKELIVADKPAGMPCHPLRLGECNTLLQWVGEQFPEVLTAGDKPREGGLLHRLDTDTSGCVAFARTPKAYAKWAPRFLEGGIGKKYLAIVMNDGANFGDPLPIGENKTIDIPLARSSSDAGRMVAVVWGDEKKRGPLLEARTEIRTLALGDGCALVEATIERGRMHQIRVHLASIGHPIVGDKLYNPAGGPDCGPNGGVDRQMLHAWKLRLDDREVTAPMPEDMKALCDAKKIQWVD